MTAKAGGLARLATAWFAAGAGWDLQSRMLDHFIDSFIQGHAWLAWLGQ